ncbi:MAG TPA: antirestriction protein ArdA [Ktedonobacterales bacterium]|nr:antirestriction protein ArdA [Ktedonobacterales bacterium]
MSDFRIYAACLSSYNAGRLHGVWIEASTDADEMQEQVSAMLRTSPCPNTMIACVACDGGDAGPCQVCQGNGNLPSAEEWAVHDYDGSWPNFGETSDLKQIADFMELVEEAEERGIDPDDVKDIVDHHGAHYLNAALLAIVDGYRGHYDNLESYAEDFVEQTTNLKAIPEHIRNYIDYESMARDWKLNGDIFTIEASAGGIHVFDNH